MRRAASISLVVGLMFVSFYGPAKELETKISRVVVYPDRAMVVRTGEAEIGAGSTQVVIPGLPPLLLDDSVRVKGEATGKVTITGTEVKPSFLVDPRQKKVEELEKKLEALKDENQALEDRLASLALQKKFIASIQSSVSEKISQEMLLKPLAPEEWGKAVDFIGSSSAKLSEEERKFQLQGRELLKKIEAARKELDQVKSFLAREAKQVVISLAAAAPAKMSFEISYVVPGAGWRPVYDARADHDQGKVGLTYRAEVRQRTGEDWNDVEVALSTARPSVSGRMEELEPWYISIWEPTAYRPAAAGAMYSRADRAAPPPEEADAQTAQGGAEELKEVSYESAISEKAGAAVTFQIPRKQNIPSDENFHGMAISTKDVSAGFEYVTTPKLMEFCYLLSKFKNQENYPLLEGQINVFLGPDFVGTSRIDAVAPGEEAELYLGIDEDLKVKRELISETTEKGGIFKGRPGEKNFKYRITVENYRKSAEKVTVFDQIPVSRSPDIKVELEEAKPEPIKIEEKEKPGILAWKLDVGPGGKKTIEYEFTVEYPKNKTISGL